jgi:hypothetical protein
MNPKKKAFIISVLRRASYKWFTRWAAEKRSKLERNTYYCECCGIIGGKKDFSMDHVLPVVDPNEGFVGFDSYADRMFPDTEFGWQRLCDPCHSEKTADELITRKETKKKKKT